ncbi:hypothetical protein [Robiginitalea sp.]|uniref:hypothetical protein n=1 Tax=Robiginitalea sp. TaxID=1902411 RepID=UPI003C5BB0A0
MSGIFNKVLFWFQAKNKHGVHSPFIYEFLDRAVYTKALKQGVSRQRLLRAARVHFNPKRIWWVSNLPGNSGIRGNLEVDSTLQGPPFDLLVFDKPSHEVGEILSDPGQWHNDSIVYLGNLRGSASTYALWEQISLHPSVRVVVESYREGLLFFRKEQAKQHFKIRT